MSAISRLASSLQVSVELLPFLSPVYDFPADSKSLLGCVQVPRSFSTLSSPFVPMCARDGVCRINSVYPSGANALLNYPVRTPSAMQDKLCIVQYRPPRSPSSLLLGRCSLEFGVEPSEMEVDVVFLVLVGSL